MKLKRKKRGKERPSIGHHQLAKLVGNNDRRILSMHRLTFLIEIKWQKPNKNPNAQNVFHLQLFHRKHTISDNVSFVVDLFFLLSTHFQLNELFIRVMIWHLLAADTITTTTIIVVAAEVSRLFCSKKSFDFCFASNVNMFRSVYRIKFYSCPLVLTLLPFAHVGSCEVAFISLGVLFISTEKKLFLFFLHSVRWTFANSCRFGLDNFYSLFLSRSVLFNVCMCKIAYFRRFICWVIKLMFFFEFQNASFSYIVVFIQSACRNT